MSRRAHRLLTLAGAMLFALAACGPAPLLQGAGATAPTTVPAPEAPSAAASPTFSPPGAAATRSPVVRTTASISSVGSRATSSPAGQVSVVVYFTAGGRLVTETRLVAAATPARSSVEALLAGPRTAGHFSQVPTGTRLLGINLAAGTATVNLSNEVQNLQGSPAIPLFLGQLVDTLTQFPDVQHVVLEVNGQPVRSLGGEGAAVPEPLDRATVQHMLAGT